MPVDPHAQRFLDILAAAAPAQPASAGIEERRRAFRRLMGFTGTAAAIGTVEECRLPGPDGPIGARLYTPLAPPAERTAGMVFFHGGGLVAGGLDTHDEFCRILANETLCRIVSVDYRLAPEHRFPAALSDAKAATVAVLENAAALGLDPARVGVGGDSAGAALAAIVCHEMRDGRGPEPAFQLLMCPLTDFAAQTRSRRDFGTGYLLDQATLRRDLELYLPPGVDAANPRISPLRSPDFRDLPPAFIHTAEFDPLRDEGAAYADRLRDAGVGVAHTCHRGMIHLFYGLPGLIPYGRSAMSGIGAEIRAALG